MTMPMQMGMAMAMPMGMAMAMPTKNAIVKSFSGC